MNTTLSIRVDNRLKQSFLKTSKERWLDGAVLIRRFMERVSSDPSAVTFDIDDTVFDAVFSKLEITSKLEKISDKLDVLWL